MLKRVQEGLAIALWPGAGCAVLAAVVYALDDQPGEAITGVSLLQLIALYAAATVGSGILLGVLKEHATSLLRKALISIPVAWPVAFTAMLLSSHSEGRPIDRLDVGVSMVLAIVGGAGMAVLLHSRGKW